MRPVATRYAAPHPGKAQRDAKDLLPLGQSGVDIAEAFLDVGDLAP
ncbi:MAG: hypothetical protein JF887_08580 [Candidatus Dormibacteraeota bacterium]|uniref:Uncharacterized protein n=1 Tax=Candidatus Amunia macphersoniae TaxID=3127014 RepID=A0A934KN57_9BACT|nr:hypothetical protein [Candidatus Dormibacteraeota bacterium]